MDCGKQLLPYRAFAIKCFTLAQTYLPSNDSSKLKANISYYRATAILTSNESIRSLLVQAINDANTYVEQFPSFKVIKVYYIIIYFRTRSA